MARTSEREATGLKDAVIGDLMGGIAAAGPVVGDDTLGALRVVLAALAEAVGIEVGGSAGVTMALTFTDNPLRVEIVAVGGVTQAGVSIRQRRSDAAEVALAREALVASERERDAALTRLAALARERDAAVARLDSIAKALGR